MNPLSWFTKKIIPNKAFIWAKVNPIRPHVSLSELSDSESPEWSSGIKITGATMEDASRLNLLGRVIDWDRFSQEERDAIKTRSLTLSLKKLMFLVR